MADPKAAAPAAAVASAAPQSLYFVNGWVDYALIGVLSIATFVLLRTFYTGDRTDHVITLAWQLSWVCNWPHFTSTSYRLYHSPDNVRQYPLTALIVPWVVIAGALGSFAAPTVIAPYFVKLVSIWSPYHFSGQTLGIALIYARRAGVQVGKAERFALSSFIYSTFIAQTIRYETGRQSFDDSGITYPSMGLPSWSIAVANLWLILTGLALLFFFARWCLRNKRMIPPIVLLPALTQFVWFGPGSGWQSFNEFVPFFHSLQYLLIAWSMQLKEKMDLDHIKPSARYVGTESARWGLMNLGLGAFFFYVLPHITATRIGVDVAFATGVIVGAVQLHHFFIDGVIWKLKRKTVVSPLMVNLSEMVHVPAAAGASRA